MNLLVEGSAPLIADIGDDSQISIPGDKSLSHRAALFSALAKGESHITNFLDSGVTRAMLNSLTALGVQWSLNDGLLSISGQGLQTFQTPLEPLNCGNSATTLRLLAGALAASGVAAVLDGSDGLRKRPMGRIVQPLRQMGVALQSSAQGTAPLVLSARPENQSLIAGKFQLEQASAQVKTCLLLAGLAGDGEIEIIEPAPSRDHSERMLRAMGVKVFARDRLTVVMQPPSSSLLPLNMRLPGDFSAAAFLIVAAVLVPGSQLWLRGIGLNPGRTGLLEILMEMGADISILNQSEQGGEPQGDIFVCASKLQGVKVSGDRVVQMIDEFPIFAVAAALAEGETQVTDAVELRFKESDRIAVLVKQLALIGVNITEHPDGFVIKGGQPIAGGEVDSQGDHRLAMSLAVAGLVSQQPVVIRQAEMINESFPQFVELVNRMGGQMVWQ